MSWTCKAGHENTSDWLTCHVFDCFYGRSGTWHGVGPEPNPPALDLAKPPPPSPLPHARAIFDEAHKIIGGERRSDYGDARKSFERIALTWSAVLGVTVTPEQVCLCMVGLKICREANGHKRDSLVDICGYTGLLEEMHNATP